MSNIEETGAGAFDADKRALKRLIAYAVLESLRLDMGFVGQMLVVTLKAMDEERGAGE